MKRICIIGPALKMGGIERESVNFANSITASETTISFISIFKSNHFFTLKDNITLYEPLDFNVNSLNVFKTIKYIRNTVKLTNPDAILVYNKFYGAITTLALLLTKNRIFISEASSPLYSWGFKQGCVNNVAYFLRPPDGVKAQTLMSVKYLKKYYSKKTVIKVIPNPLRNVILYPNIKRENWVLAVGRFGDPLKGFDRLIEAFAKIRSRDWKLVFAGGNEDGQYLKDKAADLGIIDRIIFLGQVKDIDKIYAQASIFVIPSRSEGYPNALCEAMAAGLPCISFDFISGPRDIITDGKDGIIVENGNIVALAEAIDLLIKNPEKREILGKSALKIRKRLEPGKITKMVIDFMFPKDN